MVTQALKVLYSLFDRLTHPPIVTDQVDDNLRMRLISSLFLIQIMIAIFIVIAYVPFQSDSIAIPAAICFGLLSTVCYAISRTRHYRLSIYLYIALMIVALFGLFTTNSTNPRAIPEYSLSYLIIVVFFTSILLSFRATLIVTGISLLGIASLPLMVDPILYPLHFVWLFVLVASVLIIITVMIRRNVFQRLQESETQARNLMEAYMDAVVIHSSGQGILAINPAFTNLLGYSSEDIIGKPFASLANAESSRDMIKEYSQLSHKSEPYEVRLTHQNGSAIVVELISQPYLFNNESAQVVVARDMRQYKDTIRLQHEQEMRFQNLLDLTDDAVFISDFEGTYFAVNQKASELLGLSAEELVGKSFREFIPDVYHTASQRAIERLVRGEHVPMYERTFIKANGHRFPAEVTLNLLCDMNNEPQAIHSVVRDISERKKAEDQRIELAIERERMSTLQNFLRDASHYFRTPLTSLKTSQYLLTQIKDNPEKHDHHLNVIKLEVARLERLISDMMLSSQLEQDAGNGITFGRLDLASVMPEIIQTFSPFEKRDSYAEIVIDPPIPEKTLYIMASRSKLSVAIHRLLENSITYSPVDSKVIVNAYQHEQNVCITVQDEGIGITEEEMPFLFERFRRADRAIEMAHVGNGLGLFIAQKIVEMHYGEITVESTPDEGSTFTICLPMALHPKRKKTATTSEQA